MNIHPHLPYSGHAKGAPGEVSEAALRGALDDVVRNNLQPVATGLAILYTLLTAAHLLVLPRALAAPMTLLAAATAVVLFGLRMILKRRSVPSPWIYPIAAGIAALVLINSSVHLYLSAEPQQTTNFMLLIIAVSFFLLSRRWFVAVLIVILTDWSLIAANIDRSPEWLHYGFALFMAVLVAALIHLTHVSYLRRIEGLRLRQEQQNARLQAEIEERRQAEQALRESEDKYHDTMAELAHVARLSVAGEMASGLAHELNQPLTAIATAADAGRQLLQSQRTIPEDLSKILEQIAAQSHRAGQIIHRMKTFTRKAQPRWTRIDINSLLLEAIRFQEPELRQRAVRLGLELDESLPLVHADPIQIQQVVINLVRNGIEALDDSPAEPRELEIRTMPTGADAVEITVRDTGPGFSAEAAERLFLPFFTTKDQGMGLGLSISKSIIEAHGGRLWMTPNASTGVTLHFTLAVAEPAAARNRGHPTGECHFDQREKS